MSDAPAGAPGALLGGRYRLDDVLGRGGMAEVYRGFDTVLDRPVAVKLFHASAAVDDTAPRHHGEVATLARLDHPNLVTLLDGGVDGDRPFVVMQLVEGGTLAAYCAGQPLTAERTAAIGVALAEALGYVHSRGVVHRDVKPANVLIDSTGRVRLADFGIARVVDAARLTATGFTVGTAAYLAPEQVSGELVGPPADIYALGLVLLECLTGRPEYPGQPVEAAVARLHREPSIPASLPPAWRELLAAMTARPPDVRPSAEEVALRLRGLSVEAGPAVDSSPTTVTQTLPTTRLAALDPPVAGSPRWRSAIRRHRSARWVALAAVVALLVLVGVLLSTLVGGGSPPPLPTGPSPVPGPDRLGPDLQQLQQAVQP